MSTTALTGLRDYLTGTLSNSNMIWLATQLTEFVKKQQQEPPIRRYTMDEVNAMLDEAEADIAAGRVLSEEEVMREWEEELEREEQEEYATEELEMA